MTKEIKQNRYIFSVTEAAKFLSVSPDTLRNWEEKGKLVPERTKGGSRRYKLAQLNKISDKKRPYLKQPISKTPIQQEQTPIRTPIIATPAPVMPETPSFEPNPKDISDTIDLMFPSTFKQDNNDHQAETLISAPVVDTKEATGLFEFTPVNIDKLQQAPKTSQNQSPRKTVLTVSIAFTLILLILGTVLLPMNKSNKGSNLAGSHAGNGNILGVSASSSPLDAIRSFGQELLTPFKTLLANKSPDTLISQNADTNPNSSGFSRSSVLAATASAQYLEINADTTLRGDLTLEKNINNLSLSATTSGILLADIVNNRSLTVTGNVVLNQPLATTASPTFSTMTLSSTSKQLVLGTNGTLTWTPTAARTLTLPDATDTLVGKATTDTLTNKTISGSDNTISNIQSSALSGSFTGITGLGTISTGTWNGTKISTGYGGTGLTSYTTGNLIYSSASDTLSKLAIGTAGQVLTVSGGVPTWADASGGVTSVNSLTGALTIAGAGINAISTSGATITITGTEADTLATVTGRGATTSTAVTFSSTINSNTFSSTALTFAGASPAISASTAGTNISLNAGTSGKVTIAGTSTGDVDIAGGSTDTGCTISNTTGNLTCAGDITGGSTGTSGYWTRTGTSLAPATAGDSVTTTGGISTTGSGTLSIGGTATFNSTINSNTFTSTALTFAGTTPVISASTTATDISVNPGVGGNVLLAGGSASYGCSVNDTTGDLTCTGTIASAGTGAVGYWQSDGLTPPTLSPAGTGGHLTTSGNIYTSGTGTITSGGLLTGQTGLTVTGGTASLNASSNYNTNINTGNSSGTISIGNSLAGAITLQSGAASTFHAPANTATAFRFTDGTNAYQTLDTRTTLSGVSAFTFAAGTAPTIASAANAEYTTLTTTPPTITLTGTDQVTSQMDSILFNAPTITDSSAVTVDKASTFTIAGAPISGASGSVTLTDSYALKINSASVDSGTGTVTNAYGLYVDAPTGAATNNYMAYFNSANTSGTDFQITNTGIMAGTVAGITANSATTGDLLTISGTALTSGSAVILTGPSGGTAGVTDASLKISSDVGNIGTSNGLISSTATFDGSTATGINLYLSSADAIVSGNTDYGIYNTVSNTGAITTETKNVYGEYTSVTGTGGTTTTPTTNVYGSYLTTTATHATDVGTINQYGLYIANGTSGTNGTSTKTGLYIAALTGADTNYAAIFAGGNVGIGDTSPTAPLTVGNGDVFQVSAAGAVTAVGVNSGSGLIQGTGGQTVSGNTTLAATAGNTVAIGNSTGAMTLASGGTSAWTNTGGNLTISTATSGTLALTSAAALNLTAGGTSAMTFSSSVATGTTTSSGFVFTDNSLTTGTGSYFSSSSITQGKLVDINTGSANTLTTGKLLNVASTATSLTTGSLLNLDWSPTGSTNIYATGDLMSVGTGNAYAFVGNLFNVKSQGSSVFSVSDTAVTSALPTAFNAAGDVSVAYDINMTNPTVSYIKSQAPLYINAGEVFNSSDLNLTTYHEGSIILNQDNQPTAAATSYAVQILPSLTSSTNSMTYTALYGTYTIPTVNLSGNAATDLTTAYSNYTGLTATAGTIGTWYGNYVAAPTGSGTVTTSYGLAVAALSGATSTGLDIGALSGATANLGINVGAISGAGTSSALTTGANSATGATAYQLNLGAISGANATSHTGINIGNISGTTAAAAGITLGTLTGGTSTNYQISTGTLTGIASATNTQLNLGTTVGAASATSYGINVGAISGAGTASYGINVGANSSTATTNYGMKIGAVSGAGTNNYGLYVDTVSGAGTGNYAAIFNGGNVGIGTATPSVNLQVAGDSTTWLGDINSAGGDRLVLVSTYSNNVYIAADSTNQDPNTNVSARIGFIDNAGTYGSHIVFETNSTGGISTTTTERMRIQTNGNVGIGDSSPDYLLELYDATNTPAFALSDDDIAHGVTTVAQTDVFAHLSTISTTDGGAYLQGLADNVAGATALQLRGIQAADPTDTVPALFLIGAKASGTGVQDLLAAETVFQVANNDNTAALTILGDGKLGIGDTTPSYALEVNTDISANYVAQFFNDGNNADRYGIQIQAGADDASGTTYYLNALDGDGGQVGYIANTAGTFALTDPSDIRTKTNITDTQLGGLDIINGLRVVDFNRLTNPNGPKITGFIAQEAQEIFPQMVNIGPDGMLGVSKETLIPVLVKGMQEQSRQIGMLDEQISSGQSQINQLSANIPVPQPTTSIDNLKAEVASMSARLAMLEASTSAVARLPEASSSAASDSGVPFDSFDKAQDKSAQGPQNDNTSSDILGLNSILEGTPSASTLSTFQVGPDSWKVSDFTALNATISGTLKSLGETFLGNTLVAGNFSVDGTMSITGNSINSIACANTPEVGLGSSGVGCLNSGILYLQNSPLAKAVDFFNGKVKIDKLGNINTQGEVTTKKLNISSKDFASASIGSGQIIAGDTQAIIPTTAVTISSKIFITPTTPTGEQSLIVSEKLAGSGFTVTLEKAYTKDIKFDWFIVDETN